MSHYFENDNQLLDKPYEINFEFNGINFSFNSNSGVFSKTRLDHGSLALMKVVIKRKLEGYILDLGCGIGSIGLVLAFFDKNKYCLVDINEKAIELCQKNAQKYKLNDRVEILTSNSFTNINEKIFDYILLNPPIRAGKQAIYILYKDSYDHLIDGGQLFIVVRKSHGALSHAKYLESIFQKVILLEKDKGYYVYCAIKQH